MQIDLPIDFCLIYLLYTSMARDLSGNTAIAPTNNEHPPGFCLDELPTWLCQTCMHQADESADYQS